MLTAIIAAAGSGTRMGMDINKQFLDIAGQPVLTRTLLSLTDFVDHFVIVARAGEEELCQALAAQWLNNFQVVTGGATRQQSVYSGLCAAGDSQWILVHDGCRPFVPRHVVADVVAAARRYGAAIPVIPVVDTVKLVAGKFVQCTLDREKLCGVQTPQVFKRDLLWRAHCQAREKGIEATDDAALVEALGYKVAVVPGSVNNLKITYPRDLKHRSGVSKPRVGIGYDVHRLVEDRPLFIGGIKIPHGKGLLGHSDADVLVHALMDALLGAAALGDLGRHFPDSDEGYRGADSCTLLSRVVELLQEYGYRTGNVDATIIAQQPKLAAYIPRMVNKLATILFIPPGSINIKATTTEGLGFAGRGEGIAAQCICTLLKEE